MDKLKDLIKNKIMKNKFFLIILGVLVVIIIACVVTLNVMDSNIGKDEIIGLFDKFNKTVTMGEVLKEEVVDPIPDMSFGSNDYTDFITTSLDKVNFKSLNERNNDTVGWLHVNGTNINYPVVQAVNNTYYLNRSFTKANNASGWVFMDFRNDINNLQDNTIIYAHGQTKDTMFSTLKNILTPAWQENKDNHTITVLTAKETLTWQVFSVYKIKTETYYLISSFGSDESHQKYINTVLGRSIYNFGTDVTVNDKFLTLSTCLNDEIKIVLHAKLVDKKPR
ncbi:MAG: class B sortase [Ruminococcus sp.]|nr:class B sortase [Ruminococcus sp.]